MGDGGEHDQAHSRGVDACSLKSLPGCLDRHVGDALVGGCISTLDDARALADPLVG